MKSETKKSMEQFVYEELKKAILSRKLAPGNKLIESTIAEKLNVSRTPIRGDLKRLSSDSLVDIIPNKGAFVIKPTIEEIVQAYEIRKELEMIGLKYSFDKIDENDINKLKEFTKQERISINKKDIEAYLSLNKEFHMILVRKSNNKFLIEFTEKIIDQINIYLILYDLFYDVDTETILSPREHAKIIEILEQKKLETLKKVLKNHLKCSLDGIKTKKIDYKSLGEIF